MKKMSTMLGLIFFSSLFFTANSNADSCSTYSSNEVKNTSEKVIFCIDDRTGKESVIDVAKERARILRLKGGSVYTIKTTPVSSLSKKQLREYGLIADTGASSGSGRNRGGNGNNNDNDGNNGNGNGNADGNGSSRPNRGGNANGSGSSRPNRDGNGDGSVISDRPGRTVYNKDPLAQAEDDFYILKDFCGGLTDRIEQRDADIRDIQA